MTQKGKIPKIWMSESEERIHADDAMEALTIEVIKKGKYSDQTVIDMKNCIEYLVERVNFLELLKD